MNFFTRHPNLKKEKKKIFCLGGGGGGGRGRWHGRGRGGFFFFTKNPDLN